MPIIASTLTTDDHAQADGSVWVYERHVDHTGKAHAVSYLAPVGFDTGATLAQRAANIGAAVDAKEASLHEAANFTLGITKLEFRNLFTYAERLAVDAFNAGFEAHPGLTAEQKAMIRTSLEDFKVAENVVLTNAATVAGVNLYETLGLIAPGRAAEILGA